MAQLLSMRFILSLPSLLLVCMFSKLAAAMSTPSSTPTKKTAALVFMHGLGDTPAGWSSLATVLPQLQPCLSSVEYVFPAAPTLPISINGGMRMSSWFDIYDWPISVGIQDDPVNKLKAVDQMEAVIAKLEQEKGIPRTRIVVGGFSQGGAIALLTAFYSSSTTDRPARPPLAGCVSLSGWLTLTDTLVPTLPKNNIATPLFWAHGKYDDKVLFEHQAAGIQQLKQRGLQNIQAHDYPMGHESHPDEMQALANFLKRVLFSNDKEEEEEDEL